MDDMESQMPKVSAYYTNTCTATFTTQISCAASIMPNWWPNIKHTLIRFFQFSCNMSAASM